MSGHSLKIVLTEPRGFCEGVVRAIDIVDLSLDLWGPPIYVKHEIVHNRHVVERLRQRGAIFVEDLGEVPQGARLIYSAHGVSPEVRLQAKGRQLIEIDATCPLVTKVHSAVKRFASKGYQIILIGHRNHVEIIGTAGEAPDKTHVVESAADVEALYFEEGTPLFYITQTTLSLDDVKEISDALVAKYPHIETLPSSSICYATTNRQMALRAITSEVDLILVIGDQQSSNSNRLCEVARRRGVPAYLINGADEIDAKWCQGVRTLGITAGASTPESIVQSCIERLRELGVSCVTTSVFTKEEVEFGLPPEIRQALARRAC